MKKTGQRKVSISSFSSSSPQSSSFCSRRHKSEVELNYLTISDKSFFASKKSKRDAQTQKHHMERRLAAFAISVLVSNEQRKSRRYFYRRHICRRQNDFVFSLSIFVFSLSSSESTTRKQWFFLLSLSMRRKSIGSECKIVSLFHRQSWISEKKSTSSVSIRSNSRQWQQPRQQQWTEADTQST